jgi:5,10-methylenetetrahydromethanopterin reductase
VEFFLHAFPLPGESTRLAVQAEADGWDGLLLADSQNLQAEVFVELALAVKPTERLLLGTGVTNPATRHPAVSPALPRRCRRSRTDGSCWASVAATRP